MAEWQWRCVGLASLLAGAVLQCPESAQRRNLKANTCVSVQAQVDLAALEGNFPLFLETLKRYWGHSLIIEPNELNFLALNE